MCNPRMMARLRGSLRYNTVQFVSIKSTKLAIIFRVCQLAIMLYILVAVIILKKGYQRFEPVSGTTVIKTKGSAFNAGGIPWLNMTTQPPPPLPPTDFTQVYDSSDLVYPSMERDSSFITTNFWLTSNQTRGQCFPGSDDWYNFQFPVTMPDPAAQCDSLCVRGTVVNEADTRSGGVWTGGYTLKPASSGPFVNCYCELYTWCPDENIPDSSIGGGPFEFKLKGVENWTVSFRQNVEFKAFNTITTNLSPKDSKVPPLWPIGEMIRQTGYSYDEVRAYGAVIVMQSDWNCNLDYSVDSCNPTVSFVSLANSFNFRRVEYTSTDGIDGARQLIKHFGIRIIVILTGTAGKFDMAALLTTIGSGIGLLAVASLIADFTAVNVLGKRTLYEKAKFKEFGNVDPVTGRSRAPTQAEPPAGIASASMSSHGIMMESSRGDMRTPLQPNGPPYQLESEDVEEAWGQKRTS